MNIRIRVQGVAAAANPLLAADREIRKAAVRQVRKAGNLIRREAERNIRRMFVRRDFLSFVARKPPLRSTMRVVINDEKVRVVAQVLPVGIGRAQGTVLELGGQVARRSASATYRVGNRRGQRKPGASASFRSRRAHTAQYGAPRPFLEPAVMAKQEQVFQMIGGSFDFLGGTR